MQEGIVVKRRRHYKVPTKANKAHPVLENVLDEKFVFARPSAAWATDVTCIWMQEGWLYLATIFDICSRRVVGMAIGVKNDTTLAIEALRNAIVPRRAAHGWLHHSDRGSVYAVDEHRRERERFGGLTSMSRKDNSRGIHSTLGNESPIEYELKLHSVRRVA